jgi:hypothetical protein
LHHPYSLYLLRFRNPLRQSLRAPAEQLRF